MVENLFNLKNFFVPKRRKNSFLMISKYRKCIIFSLSGNVTGGQREKFLKKIFSELRKFRPRSYNLMDEKN